MPDRTPDQRVPRKPPEEFLPFRPWMLAIAVLLACALGVAIMEDLRAPREMWARASVRVHR